MDDVLQVAGHIRHDDGEFVAADAAHEIGATEGHLQQAGYALEHLITNSVTVGVVDGFELVDIGQDEREVMLAVVVELQGLVERSAIEQVGQRVVLGLMLDDHVRGLVFREHAVIRFRQHLQLAGALHGEQLVGLDAVAEA